MRWRAVRILARAATLCWFVATAAVFGASPEPAPVLYQTAPGRFEIAATQADEARRTTDAAEEAWRLLSVPLGLPESFSTAVYVRVVPGAGPDFVAQVEPGGVVSVWLRRDEGMKDEVLHRALVRGLLLRLMVWHHGTEAGRGPPRWLEEACLGWWRTRAEPAQLDALRQESAKSAPPRLAELLHWSREQKASAELSAAAVWWLAFAQAESVRGREWPAWLRTTLAGQDGLEALASCYPGRFTNERERELWWQTGFHQHRRIRPLPLLNAEESRALIGEWARFVIARDGRDVALSRREALTRGRERWYAAEIAHRQTELTRVLPALHAFYRNAGLSLSDALLSQEPHRDEAWAKFEQDWADAQELEAASTATLEAMEPRGRNR